MLSDHSLVICRLPVAVERASVFDQQERGWRRVDRVNLRRVLEESELCQPVYLPMLTSIVFSTYTTPY